MKKKILTLGVVLALVSVLVMPGAVIADNTTPVTGSVVEGYTFTAPSGFDIGDMTPGTPKTGSSTDGSLVGNNTLGYTVTGTDGKTTDKGHMVDTTVGTTALEDPLMIGPTADPLASAATVVEFLSTDAPTEVTIELHVSQLATVNDPVDDYTITITFEVTPKT